MTFIPFIAKFRPVTDGKEIPLVSLTTVRHTGLTVPFLKSTDVGLLIIRHHAFLFIRPLILYEIATSAVLFPQSLSQGNMSGEIGGKPGQC
jgi:hypothetical protein